MRRFAQNQQKVNARSLSSLYPRSYYEKNNLRSGCGWGYVSDLECNGADGGFDPPAFLQRSGMDLANRKESFEGQRGGLGRDRSSEIQRNHRVWGAILASALPLAPTRRRLLRCRRFVHRLLRCRRFVHRLLRCRRFITLMPVHQPQLTRKTDKGESKTIGADPDSDQKRSRDQGSIKLECAITIFQPSLNFWRFIVVLPTTRVFEFG